MSQWLTATPLTVGPEGVLTYESSVLVGTALVLHSEPVFQFPAVPFHVFACARGTKQDEASNAARNVLNGAEDMEITQANKRKGTDSGANPTSHDDTEYHR